MSTADDARLTRADHHGGHRSRGDFLLSPIFLVSLAVILINDFVLKPHFPGVVSGIASDIAGFVFFPVLFVALAEFLAAVLPTRPWATPTWFLVSVGAVAVAFVLAKFTPLGERVFEAMAAPLEGVFGSMLLLPQTGLVADPWDLLAMPFGLVAWWIGIRWRGHSRAALPSR